MKCRRWKILRCNSWYKHLDCKKCFFVFFISIAFQFDCILCNKRLSLSLFILKKKIYCTSKYIKKSKKKKNEKWKIKTRMKKKKNCEKGLYKVKAHFVEELTIVISETSLSFCIRLKVIVYIFKPRNITVRDTNHPLQSLLIFFFLFQLNDFECTLF